MTSPILVTAMAACLLSTSLSAQNEQPAADDAKAPPAATSPEARAMLDQSLDKMLAYGRCTFTTSESQDLAMVRDAGAPFGNGDVEVVGGWSSALVWAEWDGRSLLRANGRMLAKVDDQWMVRRSRLSDDMPAPFVLEPDLLMTVMRELPDKVRQVAHVDEGEIRGRPVTILSLALEGDEALEFVDAGVLPEAGGGFGTPSFLLRVGGRKPPRPEYRVYLGFHVDRENGDLIRLSAKVFAKENRNMRGGVVTIVGGGGRQQKEEEEEEAPAGGPLKWQKGLPVSKPSKDESVMTLRVDFDELGLAQPPALTDRAKALLRIR